MSAGSRFSGIPPAIAVVDEWGPIGRIFISGIVFKLRNLIHP